MAVGTASSPISSTVAEWPGWSDLPSVSSWSFLNPESRSFAVSAPMLPPARMPMGPPMMPIAPPRIAPRPAPQSLDSTYLTPPSGFTSRTAALPTLSGKAPATEAAPREPPSEVEKLAARILRFESAMVASYRCGCVPGRYIRSLNWA